MPRPGPYSRVSCRYWSRTPSSLCQAPWAVPGARATDERSRRMQINVRSKIVCNGKEYSSVSELPEPIRQAYAKAIAQGGGSLRFSTGAKLVVNGREIGSVNEVPAPLRHLVEGALAAVDTSDGTNADASAPTAATQSESVATAAESYEPIVPRSVSLRWRWIALAGGLTLVLLWALRILSKSR